MYLVKRHRQWWALHDIPRRVRPAFGGRARFALPLDTQVEAVAKERAALLEAKWRREINEALNCDIDSIERRSAFWRKHYINAPAHERNEILASIKGEAFEEIVKPAAMFEYGVFDYSDPRYPDLPVHDDANRFIALATGESIRLDESLEEYLGTLKNEAKTIDMKRSTVKKFCERFRFTSDVRKKTVQQWVNDEAAAGKKVATIQRSLSEMRGYWAYLQATEAAAEDHQPFEKLALPVSGKANKVDQRKPFTPAEVVRLHTAAMAQGDDELADLITLCMWTGGRLEELCSLRTDKVGSDYFDVVDAKTPAGWRTVPIHPELAPVITRLVDKSSDGYVFSGLSENKYGDRSNALGKRFGRLKTDLGFTSNHVFHSIRKTVATLLEDAGVPENVAADIMGHDKPTMTYGLYSGGTSLVVRCEAIKKLAYPPPTME
jgi:integrase